MHLALMLFAFAQSVACKDGPRSGTAAKEGGSESGWLSFFSDAGPGLEITATASPFPTESPYPTEGPTQEAGQDPGPSPFPTSTSMPVPNPTATETATATATATPSPCVPPDPTPTLTVWQEDAGEDAAISGGAYTNLGKVILSAEGGSAQWTVSVPFAIGAARVALTTHATPYSTPVDYEGEILNCAGPNGTSLVNMTFHFPGIYGLKLEPVVPGPAPTVITFFVDASASGPAENCNATESQWRREFQPPAADYGLFYRSPGDAIQDRAADQLDSVKSALNVETLETAPTKPDAENKITAYLQGRTGRTSMTWFGHGLPSSFQAYVDDNQSVMDFVGKYRRKLKQVNFVSCCVGMGFPQGQWGSARHLLSTLADGLSDFKQGIQASARGNPAMIYYVLKSWRRPFYFSIPGRTFSDWIQARGTLFPQSLTLTAPGGGGNLTFTYDSEYTASSSLPPWCVRITTDDPGHASVGWGNNVLCGPSTGNLGLQFSTNGPVPFKRCTKIEEPSDPSWGTNSYLCVNNLPQNPILKWVMPAPTAMANCLQILEPNEPEEHNWFDNHLCFEFPTPQPGCAGSNTLGAGGSVQAVGEICSANGFFRAIVQNDRNFVVENVSAAPPAPIWASGTNSTTQTGAQLQLQAMDCNLVLRDPQGVSLWNTGTSEPSGACQLKMQDDGNLVLERTAPPNALRLWSSWLGRP